MTNCMSYEHCCSPQRSPAFSPRPGVGLAGANGLLQRNCLKPSSSASAASPDLANDRCAAYAIGQYPEVFKIVCPVDVPMFAHLLRDHPNQEFVNSVLSVLTDGFWPLCQRPDDSTVNHPNHSICADHPGALLATQDEEVTAGRYSPPFYHLLAGMKVSPLLLATKAGSDKLRLCTDMSYGAPSLNNLVRKDNTRVVYDLLASFGPYMLTIPCPGGYLIL